MGNFRKNWSNCTNRTPRSKNPGSAPANNDFTNILLDTLKHTDTKGMNSVAPNLELMKWTWKNYWRFKLIVNMLLNRLVKVLDINDAIEPATLLKRCTTFFGTIKTFLQRNISNAYKEETLVSNYVLCRFWGVICVCNRLASGISADRLKFATRTYIKREFDSKISKDKNHQKIAKWVRKKNLWCRSMVLDNFIESALDYLAWRLLFFCNIYARENLKNTEIVHTHEQIVYGKAGLVLKKILFV